VLAFPNAKINLGLNIISKRPDGYHNLETCFYPIPWNDGLEILTSPTFKFTSSGLQIPGNSNSNLCVKAFDLLKNDFDLPPVHIHLHKVIPMGAGLGGGSADGAYTLRLLNDKFELKISSGQLEKYASILGSDCPFFIQNQPTFAEGTGNLFSKIQVNLKGLFIALIHPGIHVSTKDAFAGLTPKTPEISIREVLSMPIEKWKGLLVNDFETSIFKLYPSISEIKNQFYKEGAIYASMSGSGSCVFGIFEKRPVSKVYTVFNL
jgi:4-diphosphocytidyl-2-C-methyl-D-erythritol kinase